MKGYQKILYPHRYKEGKLLTEITPEQFDASLAHPYNSSPDMQAFLVLLYYSGVRVSEALRTTRDQFQVTESTLYWDVGRRLKHGRHTPRLPLDRELPHMQLLVSWIEKHPRIPKLFDFSRTTAWRHAKAGGLGYNHHARLSAITFFLRNGRSVADVVNWFGVSVQTVNSYIGEIDLEEMGRMKR